MNPVTVYSDEQRGYWAGHDARVVVFTSPADPPGCIPCPAIVTRVVEDGRAFDVVRVAWQPDEVEVAHLARGGTIWLSTWGGLPAHALEVQAPGPVTRPGFDDPADGA